jgi:hypothetical protein
MDPKKDRLEWYGLESSGLVHGQMESSCEHRNEASEYVKFLEIRTPVHK